MQLEDINGQLYKLEVINFYLILLLFQKIVLYWFLVINSSFIPSNTDHTFYSTKLCQTTVYNPPYFAHTYCSLIAHSAHTRQKILIPAVKLIFTQNSRFMLLHPNVQFSFTIKPGCTSFVQFHQIRMLCEVKPKHSATLHMRFHLTVQPYDQSYCTRCLRYQ